MPDTTKRRWRICKNCYQRFTADKAQCPDCRSLDYSNVLAEVSEAEIEQAKQEILEKSYHGGRK